MRTGPRPKGTAASPPVFRPCAHQVVHANALDKPTTRSDRLRAGGLSPPRSHAPCRSSVACFSACPASRRSGAWHRPLRRPVHAHPIGHGHHRSVPPATWCTIALSVVRWPLVRSAIATNLPCVPQAVQLPPRLRQQSAPTPFTSSPPTRPTTCPSSLRCIVPVCSPGPAATPAYHSTRPRRLAVQMGPRAAACHVGWWWLGQGDTCRWGVINRTGSPLCHHPGARPLHRLPTHASPAPARLGSLIEVAPPQVLPQHPRVQARARSGLWSAPFTQAFPCGAGRGWRA